MKNEFEGKVIKKWIWTKRGTYDYRCLRVEFTDETIIEISANSSCDVNYSIIEIGNEK